MPLLCRRTHPQVMMQGEDESSRVKAAEVAQEACRAGLLPAIVERLSDLEYECRLDAATVRRRGQWCSCVVHQLNEMLGRRRGLMLCHTAMLSCGGRHYMAVLSTALQLAEEGQALGLGACRAREGCKSAVGLRTSCAAHGVLLRPRGCVCRFSGRLCGSMQGPRRRACSSFCNTRRS